MAHNFAECKFERPNTTHTGLRNHQRIYQSPHWNELFLYEISESALWNQISAHLPASRPRARLEEQLERVWPEREQI